VAWARWLRAGSSRLGGTQSSSKILGPAKTNRLLPKDLLRRKAPKGNQQNTEGRIVSRHKIAASNGRSVLSPPSMNKEKLHRSARILLASSLLLPGEQVRRVGRFRVTAWSLALNGGGYARSDASRSFIGFRLPFSRRVAGSHTPAVRERHPFRRVARRRSHAVSGRQNPLQKVSAAVSILRIGVLGINGAGSAPDF